MIKLAVLLLLLIAAYSSIQAQYLPLVLGGQAVDAVVTLPPPNVNMQLEGTDVLQDGACVTYYKTRDRGNAAEGRPSRGDLVWTVVDGQSVVVLEPGRAVTEGNGTLGIEDGIGSLYVVTKNNELLRLPIPEWVPRSGLECTP
jgi:hypothetical protein